MDVIELSSWAFFGILEVAVVLLVLSLVLALRGRVLSGRIVRLEQEIAGLSKPQIEIKVPGFEQYLRDEILCNQEMLERPAGSGEQGGPEAAAGLFELRRQFLELELAACEHSGNPVAREECLATGLQGLIDAWRPDANVVVEPVAGDEAEDPDIEISDGDEERETIDTTDDEFDRLKQVINNQQDAMSALRDELRQREDEIQGVESIMQKLDEFERQSAELHTCMEVLERENERLKAARDAGAVPDDSEGAGMQLTGLKAMVNDQQETITRLHDLINDLAPDADKARELEEAVSNVQRTNRELTGCVSVLEGENALLRSELEQIRIQLEQQTRAAEAGEDAVGDLSLSGDERTGTDPRVQELEALVAFKDAAIEELETRYNALEEKYQSVIGEQTTA